MISVTHMDVFALEYQPFKGSYGHKDRKLYLLFACFGFSNKFFSKTKSVAISISVNFFQEEFSLGFAFNRTDLHT